MTRGRVSMVGWSPFLQRLVSGLRRTLTRPWLELGVHYKLYTRPITTVLTAAVE